MRILPKRTGSQADHLPRRQRHVEQGQISGSGKIRRNA
jgi:hypothetical protein